MNLSTLRFFAATHWDKEDLSGKSVLEVGSGRAFNLVMLSLLNSKVNYSGIEYSKQGIARSEEMIRKPPIQIMDFVRHYSGKEIAPSSTKIDINLEFKD